MKKKIFSILFALVLVLSLSLVTAVPVGAQGSSVTTVAAGWAPDTYPVDVTVEVDGNWVQWTFDFLEHASGPVEGGGFFETQVFISYDGENPAFHVHTNGGTIPGYDLGTWLYEPYTGKGWWNGWYDEQNSFPVTDIDWIEVEGDMYYATNPTGILTVRIHKDHLGGNFYWAVLTATGHFSSGIPAGFSVYPETFEGLGPFELATIEEWAGTDAVDLLAVVPVPPEELIGIRVDQTSISFGSITPGAASQPRTVTVTNTGNVAEDFSASLANISTPDVYTTGLKINTHLVADWGEANVAANVAKEESLVLFVPTGTVPGTYTAILIFWAEAAR